MNDSKDIRLEQLKQERHETMVGLVYASQTAYAELEQAKAELRSVKRFQFLKKRKAKQNVAAKNAKMAQVESQIEAAHQKYQRGLKELETPPA